MANVPICPNIPAGVISQALASNPQIIVGEIAQTVIQKSPFLDILERGNLPAYVAQSYTAVAEGIPDFQVNMGAPPTTNWSTTAGTCSAVQSTSGSNAYNYNAFLDQSVSQPITLQGGFQAVEGALMSTVKSYVAGVTDWIAADIQYNLFLQSGVKVVVQSGVDISAMFFGTYLSYATPVPALQPTAGLDWNLVQQINTLMQEDLRCDPFPDGTAQLLTGYSTLNSLRDELGGSAGQPVVAYNPIPIGQLAAGGNKMAWDTLTKYAMEVTNRGIRYRQVPRPLRLNWTGSGFTVVSPVITQAYTNGVGVVPNPAWQSARYEVATLIFANSFKYLLPQAYTGEDKIRFGMQFFTGEPQFLVDNLPNNIFKNYGVLGMQFGRAYKPIKPWQIASIIFKRCLNPVLSGCSGVSQA